MKLKRWEVILKYIVEDFIETAQPVGSKSLLKKHKLNYSSATIRNEMMELEEMGYIEKTHTSSGRIPSINGYRYYVTKLRSDKIDKTIKYEIDRLVDNSTSVEDLLYESCEMLSNMTQLASCYLGPNVFAERIRKIECVELSLSKFTLLFITDRGYCENKTFILPKDEEMITLISCVNKIDNLVNGTRLVDIFQKLSDIKNEFKDYEVEFNYINRLFMSMLKDFIIKRNSQFYGKDYLLDQPEFKDNIKETRTLVNLLSHPYRLNKMFDDSEETMISIGNGELKDISIITKNIKVPNSTQDIGKIAVVGPTRMDYSKVLKYLDYITEMVAYHLSDLERKEYGRREKDGRK